MYLVVMTMTLGFFPKPDWIGCVVDARECFTATRHGSAKAPEASIPCSSAKSFECTADFRYLHINNSIEERSTCTFTTRVTVRGLPDSQDLAAFRAPAHDSVERHR